MVIKLPKNGQKVPIFDHVVYEFPDSGGLNGTYIFHQMHFHWSSKNSQGSEHTKSGTTFPLEVQLIHFKEDYGDIQSAMKQPEGIAILAIFFQVN